MKRKLSLFLAICLMLGNITPALDARAASTTQEEVQIVAEDEITVVDEELSDEDNSEIAEEETEVMEEVVVPEETPTEEVVTPEETLEEPMKEETPAEEVVIPEETPEVPVEEAIEEEVVEEVIEEFTETYNSTSPKPDESFSGEYGADNADVSVKSYSYGADLLVIHKGSAYPEGILGADGVLIVEKAADVDLTAYADGTTTYTTDETEYQLTEAEDIEEVVYVDADGGKKTTKVRFIPTDKTYKNYRYSNENSFYNILMSVYGLNPETEYSYVFVEYDYNYSAKTFKLSPALSSGETAVVRNLVTAEAKESELAIQVESSNSGYSTVEAEVTFSGMNGQKIVEIGMTSGSSGDVEDLNKSRGYEFVTITENLPEGITDEMTYYGWTDWKKFNHPFAVGENAKQVKPYIIVDEYTDNGYVEKRYEGNTLDVTRKDINNLTLEKSKIVYVTGTSVEIASFFGNVERSNDIGFQMEYRKVGEDTWTKHYSYKGIDSSDLGNDSDYSIGGLEEGTEYEYQYQIYGVDREVVLRTIPGGTFTTEGAAFNITKADIPDPALWAKLAGTDDSISSEELLEITSLYIYGSDVESIGTVKDLTGIGYLKNLKSLTISGHKITDASPVLDCKRLEMLSFYKNELTTVPDFSGLTSLYHLNLNNNQLTNDVLAGLKYPEGATLLSSNQMPTTVVSLGNSTICKESQEKRTYVAQVRVENAPSSVYSMHVKFEDVTDADNIVAIYENTAQSSTYTRTTYEEYNGTGYELVTDIAGLTLTEGARVLRVSWIYNGETYSQDIAVTVDPNAVGDTWEILDEEFPAALKNSILSDYSSKRYDTNNDGKLSYAEVAKIKDLYLIELGLTNYGFLKYMPSLETLYISGEEVFTNEMLAEIGNTKELENLKYLTLSYMDQITDIKPISKLTSLQSLTLDSLGNIGDVSALASLTKLTSLSLFDFENLTGLAALKNLPLTYFYAYSGTFTDLDIFNFICNKTEVVVKAAETASLVSDTFYMNDTTGVEVEITPQSVAGTAKDDVFTVYGFTAGEAVATLSYEGQTYEVDITVEGASFDYDPPVGVTVPEADRMKFEGTEGLENARVSRTLVDSDENIWNISGREPEKLLESGEYTKYAARIIYNLDGKFGVRTNTPRADYSMYLDEEGTLWAYSKNFYMSNQNFKSRVEVMRDVADWQDGGYYQGAYHDYTDEYLLILRTDGSLWFVGYEGNPNTIKPTKIQKLEESGTVASIHTHSYLTKDGKFYRTYANYYELLSPQLIAENVVKVWDNTSHTIVQDASGKYYNESGPINISGTVKDFLVANYWNPDYVELIEYDGGYYGGYRETGVDLIASYLLMEDGKLYRTKNSYSSASKKIELFDTGVTALEKDYYWKGDKAYVFTGETYEEYIGSGAGHGLYPVKQSDGTMTLYVNGVPYLTKVVDWTISDYNAYAIRTDNTLWWFDENHTPEQLYLDKLDTTAKESPKDDIEIDIVDLENGLKHIKLEWNPVDGAASYQVSYGISSNEEIWTSETVTDTNCTLDELEIDKCYYFKIVALDSVGAIIGESHKFFTYTSEETLVVNGVTVEVGKTNATASFNVTVGPESLSGDYQLEVYVLTEDYNEETGESSIGFEKSYYLDCPKGGNYTIKATGLPKNTWFGAYVYLNKDGSNVDGRSASFDTMQHLYLTEEDIPDEAFRELLRDYSQELDLYELQDCTYLHIDDPEIKDFTGLELFTNLTGLYITGLKAEVVMGMEIPKTVEQLSILYCGLEEIPDLSYLPKLSSLDLNGNRIPEEEFYAKNPALKTFVANMDYDLHYWLEDTAVSQLGDPVAYISDVYYKTVQGSYPFFFELGKVDTRHEIQLNIYENETLLFTEKSENSYEARVSYTIEDVGLSKAGQKTWKIVVKDLTDGVELYNQTKEISFVEGISTAEEDCYLPTVISETNKIFKISAEHGAILDAMDSVGTGRVTDSNGNQYDVYIEYWTDRAYPEEYEVFHYVDYEYIPYTYYINVDFPYVDEEYHFPLGKMDVTVLDGDIEAFTIKGALEVVDSPIIYDVYVEQQHFNVQGDYLYVYAQGEQFGNRIPEIVVTTLDGDPVSTEEPELLFAYSPVWKFKLDEAYLNQDRFLFEVKGDGYMGITSGKLYVNRDYPYVYNTLLDSVNGGILGYASTELADGTKLNFEIYNLSEELLETTTAVVTDGKFFAKFNSKDTLELSDLEVKIYTDDESVDEHTWIDSYGWMGSSEAVQISRKHVDTAVYLRGIYGEKVSTVVIRDAQNAEVLKKFEVPANTLFEEMDLSGLNAGTAYFVNVYNEDGFASALGMFELATETRNMEFSLTDHEGDRLSAIEENEYRIDYTAALKNKTFALNVDTLGNTEAKIKATSSDTSVASVKVSGKTVKVTVKAAGTVDVKVQAADSGYAETVTLDLRDYAPRFDTTSVAINKALSRTATIAAYPVYGAVIADAVIDSQKLSAKEISADYADYFAVEVVKGGIKVTFLDDSGRLNAKGKQALLKNGSYRLPLTIITIEPAETSATGEPVIREIEAVITVKLSNTKPKVTVKQTEKINLFYTDTKAVFTLTTNVGEISNVSLVGEGEENVYFAVTKEYDQKTGTIELTPTNLNAMKALKGKDLTNAYKVKLNLTVGESTWEQSVTVGKTTTKPSVTLDQTSSKVYKFTEVNENGEKETVYAGKVLTFTPIDKKSKEVLENVNVTMTGHYKTSKKGEVTQNFSVTEDVQNPEELMDEYELVPNADGSYTIYFVGSATASVTLQIRGENWSENVKVTHKATVTTSKITGKLSASKVTLNKSYDADQKTILVTTSLPDAEFVLGDVIVTVPKKAVYNEGDIEVVKSEDGSGLLVSLMDGAELTKGTYKASIPLSFTFSDGTKYTPKALSLSISVIDEELTSKAIKWKTSGKLDAVDRAGSGMTLTPTVSKLNAVVSAVEFSEADMELGLDQKLDMTVVDGKVLVTLKEGVAVSTKDKYVINPVVTLMTEDGTEYESIATPKLTLKPVQTSMKMTLTPNQTTMYLHSGGTHGAVYEYTLKGAAGAKVKSVQFADAKLGSKKVADYFMVDYDAEDQQIIIVLKNPSVPVKTHTLKLLVTFEGQATNVKPLSVSTKVVIKK